ncbi:MAG TPA: zinc ribbon domain-containing protein [Gemmatimonadota bacterium]|nr:zinc ribbon domain-containing protein [Gemmatimonadota bacterium]
MAIYEYLCSDCKKTFTLTQSISEHDEARKRAPCPKCKGRNTQQLFSSFFAKTASKS